MNCHPLLYRFVRVRTAAFLFLFATSFSKCLLAAEPTFDFPVYKNKPSGKQLSGQHAPASTPALTPAEAQKKFKLPEGFQMSLFASEPMVVNPVAMTWDARGRLWVLELYEYPLGAKPGTRGRDRIKILEDTDNDGRADKVTVFAEGFNLATGLLLGNGGVYLGQAPQLLFLQDTNGDDKADQQTVLLNGFGLEDRHELLNGFTWGPDGWMYMTHGVFTQSAVKDPEHPNAPAVIMNAAIARFHPVSKKFEIFSDGTSNPWGVDFDATGQAFVSACVIDHLFHVVPGGLYARQAGQPEFPFAYDLLPSIVDHKHHMAAYAGIQIYQGNQYPAEYRGAAIMGNIHDNSLHWDRLTPKGSSYQASFVRDLVRGNDGWFMPVSTQTGPDGALWVMDWYDKYPCYQNANADPDGVDREYGRIWRLVYTGSEPDKTVPSRPHRDMDLGAMSSADLVSLLGHANSWQRRQAQRILTERGSMQFGLPRGARTPLHTLLKQGTTSDARLAALWTLHGVGLLDEPTMNSVLHDKDASIRAWVARLIGEEGPGVVGRWSLLQKLAQDPDVHVRLAVAIACRQSVSGRLTVADRPADPTSGAHTIEVLRELLNASFSDKDEVLNFLFWMALEPSVASDPIQVLSKMPALKSSARMPMSGVLLKKVLRRVCDLRNEALLSQVVSSLGTLSPKESPIIAEALSALVEGQRGKSTVPSSEALAVIQKFQQFLDKDVASRAQQLAVLWGDSAALKNSLARIVDVSVPEKDRMEGIRALRSQRTEDAREALFKVLGSTASDAVKIEAVRSLSEIGTDASGARALASWNTATPAARRAIAEMMSIKAAWISPFLKAVQSGEVKRGDVPPTVVRKLATHSNPVFRQKAEEVFGKFNATSEEKLKLIAEKRKVVSTGPVDLEAGHEIAKKTCFICHMMYGEGGQVGPDLTGVGRSSMDALLHNVIHPNEIIGQGYENVEIETRDGRNLSGRVVENTAVRVRMLLASGQEEVIGKNDVASYRVTANSVMPEGLEQMPDADFRNLIWFILAHPKDGKPLTEERRKELINGSGDQSSIQRPVSTSTDGESIALWNPEWKVSSGNRDGVPAKLPTFEGQKNVLVTCPSDARTPASIARVFVLPPGSRDELHFRVAAGTEDAWKLRVRVDGDLVSEQTVTRGAQPWLEVRVKLAPYGGRRVVVRLENASQGESNSVAYWSDLQLIPEAHAETAAAPGASR